MSAPPRADRRVSLDDRLLPMHRSSHVVNLWAGHVVHHSSEEFNLAVALRQSSIHD
jgi:hypothetical protein